MEAVFDHRQNGYAAKGMGNSIVNFDRYLNSLVATYKQWWRFYALTDAIGQIREPQQEQERPSLFDFGLMVQTVSKERDQADAETASFQDRREKTERLSVLEGIRKYADDHVLLAGRPGSGKSTALVRLLLEMAASALTPNPSPRVERGEPEKIPVLVELRYWQNSVTERIQAFLHKHDPTLSLDDSTLTFLLRQGRFLLLIDGLNELPSETARTQLASFRQDYSQVPMIFTTRDLGMGGDLGIEKKLLHLPLTDGQMKEFIQAYVPDQAEVMLRQLSDRLREFGQTPLLLWMLCEVFQQSPEHQMPSNLAGVFQAFTRMYEDSSVRKHEVALLKGDVRPLSDRRLWKPALQAIAAAMMQGETPVDFRVAIHRNEAEQELSKIFPNEKFPVRDILDDLLKYHLLQNRSTDQIEFRHQLIQEYYAAEQLLRLLPDLSDEQLKRDYLNLLKWTESIALMLVLIDEEQQVFRLVKLALNLDCILGARLAGDTDPKFQKLAIDLIRFLKLPQSLEIELFGVSSSEFAIQDLIINLRNPRSIIRKKCAWSLGRIGGLKACNALVQAIKDEDLFVRNSIVFALYEIGIKTDCEIALVGLIEALGDSDRDIRQNAVEALIEIDGEIVASKLIEALSCSDPEVRKNSVVALGKLQNKKSISLLTPILNDKDAEMRRKVVDALGDIGDEAAISYLSSALRDKDASVQSGAALSLRKINSLAALNELSKAEDDDDPGVRFIARFFLGKEGQKESINRLIDGANSDFSEKDDKRHSDESIGLISREEFCCLFKILRGQASGSRIDAAEKLGKIGSSEPLTCLRELWLGTEDWHYLSAIFNIQNRCKFYNHEIFHGIIPPGKIISLCFFYVPADEPLQTQLANHLTLLEHQGVITSWDKHKILPGDEPAQVINQQLNTADIILLLISASSLADDTCYTLEIQRAIERHQAGEARVIPILLRPVDWAGAPFSELEVLPKNHQPVTLWDNQDEAFREIAEDIRAVAMEVRREK